MIALAPPEVILYCTSTRNVATADEGYIIDAVSAIGPKVAGCVNSRTCNSSCGANVRLVPLSAESSSTATVHERPVPGIRKTNVMFMLRFTS